MKRASNDATLNKIGDIYQYLIALLKCFELNEGESILIEVLGDVTKVSQKDSFQMEVKHHIGEDYLSDRDVDFWKTLKNWTIEYDKIKNYDKLILYTTSSIDKDSPFLDWNHKKDSEKMSVLKGIGEIKKSREETFREIYNDIFNVATYDNKKILLILSKLEIQNKQMQIVNIDAEFNKHIKHIPEINRKNFIFSLLGLIIKGIQEPPHYWEITYKDFEVMIQDTTPTFMNAERVPLPDDFSDAEISVGEEEVFCDKEFVKAIKNIQHDKEVPKAINDYWRKNMTIAKYYKDNFIFNTSVSSYKKMLQNKLGYEKENRVIDYEDAERNVQIKESKKFYNYVMGWEASSFGRINPNREFFQKGIIHEIVDSGDFCWDIGEKV
ncbi:ABC-three component system protein [Clostridium felsineum]|uniref:Uncharacterized protein n=1 Tax=Clostridium felsineum TaxID=36839 RepID=A0A1S8LEJ0_9CLOT|nr:ABC-three component system protein [Clostridium felsineum]URZ05449.1 hypothetical protein CLROS_007750 [Clostridium felsineum]URZ10490.1 hypothetical protein CROST_012000 [Clostridium felsineum]